MYATIHRLGCETSRWGCFRKASNYTSFLWSSFDCIRLSLFWQWGSVALLPTACGAHSEDVRGSTFRSGTCLGRLLKVGGVGAYPAPSPAPWATGEGYGMRRSWHRWTAILLVSFYAASRVGEVLRASRRSLLTPTDLLSDKQILYLRIDSPKTRSRGAKIQYVSVYEPEVISYAAWVWQDLSPKDRLFPLTAGAFRSRWDAILRHLKIGKEHRLTPGSLRAGGAVALHRSGISIPDLLWRMRLRHQQTLAFYLQETTASSILPSLDSSIRDNIQILQVAFQLILSALLRTWAGPAAHTCSAVSANVSCRPRLCLDGVVKFLSMVESFSPLFRWFRWPTTAVRCS